MINNNFWYELGFGLRTREDTLFIFRTMYEKLVKEGLNDTTLGNIEYVRKELDKHREYISNKTYSIISMTTILQRIKDGLSVYMKPIITLEDLKMEGKRTINNKELECMELALITAYKTIGNIEGRIKPYVFRK